MRLIFRVTLAAAVSAVNFLAFILLEWVGMSRQGLILEGVIEHILRTILTWWILPPLLTAWAVIFFGASYLVSRK